MKLLRVTPPTLEPVTLATAKAHLRVDAPDEDALITQAIAAARDMAEQITGTAIMLQTLELAIDAFPSGCTVEPERAWERGTLGEHVSCIDGDAIVLPSPPLALPPVAGAIDPVIQYIDAAGVLQTLPSSTYVVDNYARPARITLAPGQSWPSTSRRPSAVRIRYTAGVAEQSLVPPSVVRAILFLVGHYHDNRQAVVVGTISSEVQQAAESMLRLNWHGHLY